MNQIYAAVGVGLGLAAFTASAADTAPVAGLPGGQDLVEALPKLRDFEMRRISWAEPQKKEQ